MARVPSPANQIVPVLTAVTFCPHPDARLRNPESGEGIPRFPCPQ